MAQKSGGRGTDCRRGKWQAGENLGGMFSFGPPICGFVFCSVRVSSGRFFGADGHLACGFLMRVPQDFVADEGRV